MPNFVESTKEASKGGFQGIKKVRGLLIELKRVPPPESWDTTKDQIEGTLEDAAVLEMFPGEEEFELRDSKYTFLVPYAEEGKVPHASSGYMKCWVASAEKMGKKPSDFIGQYVTLDRIPTLAFKQRVIDPDTKKQLIDENGEKVYEEVMITSVFSFVPDETADSSNIKEYVRDLVTGLNEKATLRKLLVDTRAKQYTSYKDALNNGTLADELELVLVDGKFQKIEVYEEARQSSISEEQEDLPL